MVRFLMVKSTHLGLNFRFGMSIAYLRLCILLMVGDVPVNSESLLMTDFINFKIKPANVIPDFYAKIKYASYA
jgi:hypothetical protein